MSGTLSSFERLIIVTARKYLVDDARVDEDNTIKIPFTAQDALVAESASWGAHWLYGKIFNEYRSVSKVPPDFSSFQKALLKLKEKKYLKVDWVDRYTLIVEATRFVK